LLTFKEWILKFVTVDLPIGDIARDISEDEQFPNTKDFDEILYYLETTPTSDSFIRVFKYSFNMYYESTQKL
jgi:uncharacterized protein YozE (UPF0346 family)